MFLPGCKKFVISAAYRNRRDVIPPACAAGLNAVCTRMTTLFFAPGFERRAHVHLDRIGAFIGLVVLAMADELAVDPHPRLALDGRAQRMTFRPLAVAGTSTSRRYQKAPM